MENNFNNTNIRINGDLNVFAIDSCEATVYVVVFKIFIPYIPKYLQVRALVIRQAICSMLYISEKYLRQIFKYSE